MALICNSYRLGHMPHNIQSGSLTTIYNGRGFRDISITGRTRNITAGEGITEDKVGIPVGYLHPGSWVLPQKAGRISSHNSAIGLGTATLTLVSGRALSGSALGETTTFAAGQRIAFGAGTSTGSTTLYAALNAQALMSGESIGETTATAKVTGALCAMSGTATGSSTATGQKNALALCSGEIMGACTATLISYATGSLAGHIYCNDGDASIAQMVEGLWNAGSAIYNQPGTMGERLNDAGSASNPWAETLPGAYTEGQAGYIIGGLENALDSVSGELSAMPDVSTATLEEKITWLFEYFAHQRSVTATEETLLQSDGVTPLGTSIITKDATTYTKGKME